MFPVYFTVFFHATDKIKYNKKLYFVYTVLMAISSRLDYVLIMKIKSLFFAVLIQAVFAQAVFAQQIPASQVVTVDEAVRLALNNNLSLQRSALNTGTLKRAADRSWNSFLPTVGAGVMVSHPSSITGPLPPGQDVWTPGFSLSAGLTRSTAAIENIKRARADYEAGLLTYEAARQELEYQVRRLFYQILLLDANREIAAQNFASAQARHEQSAALARAGQVPHLDELSARVDMENMRPVVRNTEIMYENALDSFKAILGLPAETMIVLDGSLSTAELAGELNGNLSGAKGRSRESLETAIIRKSIQSLEAQRKTVRNSAYIPSLRLSWNSTPLYVNTPMGRSWNDINGSFSVSLGMNLDSFLPWSNAKTQMDTLNDHIQSAQIQMTDSLRSRDNRLNQNIRTIERILESLEAMTLNVELARTTYNMFENAYRNGAMDYQRLRSARDGLEQADNRLLQEQFNLILAILDLERELNIPFGTFGKGE